MTMFMSRVGFRAVTIGSRRDLEDMCRATEQHGIRPVIDSVYAFDDAKAAITHYGARNIVAKRIIPIRVSTLAITPSAPHQFVWPQKPRDGLCQPVAVLKLVSFVIKAQTIRAILLASATAATLPGFRSSNSVAHASRQLSTCD